MAPGRLESGACVVTGELNESAHTQVSIHNLTAVVTHNGTGTCRPQPLTKYWRFVLSVTTAEKAVAELGSVGLDDVLKLHFR